MIPEAKISLVLQKVVHYNELADVNNAVWLYAGYRRNTSK